MKRDCYLGVHNHQPKPPAETRKIQVSHPPSSEVRSFTRLELSLLMLNFAQPLGVERSPNLQTVEMSVKPKKMGRSCREGFWRLQNLDMVCFLGGKVGRFPKTSFKFRRLDGFFFEKLFFFSIHVRFPSSRIV